jgi:hypothetical protein
MKECVVCHAVLTAAEVDAQGLCVGCYDKSVESGDRENMLESKRKAMRKYYLANREKILVYQRAYKRANRERLQEYRREYYLAAREKLLGDR